MKKIKGFSAYAVDEKGNVYTRFVSKRCKLGRFYRELGSHYKELRLSRTGHGYLKVAMTRDDGKVFYKKVHRLVAENYLINSENKKEVNHIDGNKENNHVSNLEWATRRENCKHASKNKLYSPLKGVKNHASKLDDIIVMTIRTVEKSNVYYSKLYNCSTCTISNAKNGKTWAHVPTL